MSVRQLLAAGGSILWPEIQTVGQRSTAEFAQNDCVGRNRWPQPPLATIHCPRAPLASRPARAKAQRLCARRPREPSGEMPSKSGRRIAGFSKNGYTRPAMACKKCRAPLRKGLGHCPHCGRLSLFPNVDDAQRKAPQSFDWSAWLLWL